MYDCVTLLVGLEGRFEEEGLRVYDRAGGDLAGDESGHRQGAGGIILQRREDMLPL